MCLRIEEVDFRTFARMKLKSDVAAVWRPPCRPRCPVKGGQLGAISSIAVADPDLHGAKPVGFKGNALPVRGKVWPQLAALGCDRDGGRAQQVLPVFQRDSPDVVFPDGLPVSEFVAPLAGTEGEYAIKPTPATARGAPPEVDTRQSRVGPSRIDE